VSLCFSEESATFLYICAKFVSLSSLNYTKIITRIHSAIRSLKKTTLYFLQVHLNVQAQLGLCDHLDAIDKKSMFGTRQLIECNLHLLKGILELLSVDEYLEKTRVQDTPEREVVESVLVRIEGLFGRWSRLALGQACLVAVGLVDFVEACLARVLGG